MLCVQKHIISPKKKKKKNNSKKVFVKTKDGSHNNCQFYYNLLFLEIF